MKESKIDETSAARTSRYIQYMYSYPHKTAYGPLKDIRLTSYLPLLSGSKPSLYLHLPFCESKCGYCNLFSVTGQAIKEVDQYLDAVERQLRQYEPVFKSAGVEFAELAIGGGTPLFLTGAQLNRCFSMLHKHTVLNQQAEIIIETAPGQTTPEKLSILKDAGVTRVSMGIQSFFDEELKTLKRNHSADKARQALTLLMEQNFRCVNVDLIYGAPGQTLQSFLSSVREAASYQVDELFLYPLYLKHGAILEKELSQRLTFGEELSIRQYEEAAKWLKNHGYRQDSMRRFVRIKTGGQERIFSSCGFRTTLSLGCGGRSYVGNLHFCTPYTITRSGCLEQIRSYEETEDFCKITYGFLLSEEEQKRRYAIRHLLILPGLDRVLYQKEFHSDIIEDFPLLNGWLEQGCLEEKDGWLFLSEQGLGLSDYLGPQLISPDVNEKMKQWEDLYGAPYAFI